MTRDGREWASKPFGGRPGCFGPGPTMYGTAYNNPAATRPDQRRAHSQTVECMQVAHGQGGACDSRSAESRV